MLQAFNEDWVKPLLRILKAGRRNAEGVAVDLKERYTQDMIRHMGSASEAMSSILRAKKEAAVRLSRYICSDSAGADHSTHSRLGEKDKVKQLNGSVVSYLNSIAGLTDTMAEQLEIVMQQLSEQEDEE